MTTAIQYDLFRKTWAQLADAWFHTAGGRHVMNRLIRSAWRYHKQGVKVGIKALWEEERLRFRRTCAWMVARGIPLPKPGDGYYYNNNFTAYAATFIEDRVPELRGLFRKRDRGEVHEPRRAVVVPLRVSKGGRM